MKRRLISDHILNAIFLQVAPGYDRNTLNEINDTFQQEHKVYIGFGKYDLIVMDERTDLSLLQKFYQSNLTHVKDWLPIWGMRWTVESLRKMPPSSEDKVLGLSFIKLNPDPILDQNIRLIRKEEDLVQEIASEKLGTPYCSLGFNELLVINRTKTFGDLSQKVVSLKEILVSDETPIALDICTVPALEYGAILEDNIRATMREPLEVVLLLSLQMGSGVRFKETLQDIVGDTGKALFGAHDVMLELSGSAGEVISKIEEVRKEGANYGLYSSFTMIPYLDRDLCFRIPSSQKQEIPLYGVPRRTDITDERFKFYKTWVQASIRDPMTKYVFADQVAFFRDNKELKKVLKDDPQAFDNILECMRIGFEQRCSALNPGNLLGAKSIRTEHLGSLQRITMAIESLPMFLFERLGYGQWPGFCIHGYIGRFYRTDGGIINVPYKFRIRPETWWGILHEVGHEIFLKIRVEFKARLRDEIKEIIDLVVRAYRRERRVEEHILQEDYTTFVEEVFAEIFGFHFGFNDNWKLYVSEVWSYFAKELELDYEHISRSVLAYLAFGPGKDLARDQITVEEIDKCIQKIEEVTKKENGSTIDEDERDKTIPIVMAFLNVADIIRSYLMKRPIAYHDREFKDIQSALSKGEVYYSDNPLEILFSFVTSRFQPTCKRRIATILSLYDCYCRYLKKMVGGKKPEQS